MLDQKFFNNETPLISYVAKVWRMVESQETAATLNIVDSMEEQALLEELLDTVKPVYREGTEGMHYLLKTAFRYPPLRHGSRFGTRLLPSFFYASEKPKTALTETAYYRFVFLHDMQQPYNQEIDSSHSLFCVSIASQRCLDLYSPQFSSLRSQLIDPVNYSLCQTIGDWAVNQKKVAMIRAESARSYHSANIAIAEPSVIRSKAPISLQSWLCRSSMEKISFSSRESASLHTFSLEDFCIDGALPRPA